MKKTNFIWILAAFLLAVPMTFAGIGERITYIDIDTYFDDDTPTTSYWNSTSLQQRAWSDGSLTETWIFINSSNLNIQNADQLTLLNHTLNLWVQYSYPFFGNYAYFRFCRGEGTTPAFDETSTWNTKPTCTDVDSDCINGTDHEGHCANYGGSNYWIAQDIFGSNKCEEGILGNCSINIRMNMQQTTGGSSNGLVYNSSNATTYKPYLKLTYDYGFDVNALDNYTKYGYNLTDISNFTVTMTNGTDTLINTSNGTTINMGDLVGLWNITLSHNEYTNRTYLNHNVSEDLTGYMDQTHEHELTSYDDCTECLKGVSIEEGQTTNFYGANYEYVGADGANDRKQVLWTYNFSTLNISAFTTFVLWFDITHDNGIGGTCKFYNQEQDITATGANCNPIDVSNITYADYSGYCGVRSAYETSCSGMGLGWESVNMYWDNSAMKIPSASLHFQSSTSSGKWINIASWNYTTPANRPYIEMDYNSNFTIAVVDSVTGDPITATDITINISNGAWSREDILSGTNTLVYPFDEGIYDISIIVEGNEQTISGYDLATESNYLEEEFTFYFNVTNCSSASSNIALNFTFRDEENQSAIAGGLTPDFTLSTDFYNTTYSEDLSDDVTNIYLCLDPSNINVTLEWPSFVEYQPTDTAAYGYTRFYYFSNMIIRGDSTQDISLFNLEDSLSSQTTFNMQKEGQNVAEGLIQILRYKEQTSYVVAMKKTSSNGQATERVRQGDALYNIFAFDADLAICYVTPTAEELSSSLSIYCDTSGVSSDYWPLWLLYHYVSYDFTYNNVTNVTTLTWAGVTGAPTQARFRVTKITGASETTTCDSTSTSTSGTLDCTLTDLDAIYNLEFIAKLTYGATTGYFILASEFLELKQNLSDLIGKDGTFLAIFIIGLLAFTGLFNPAAAVLLATLGVVITSLMGLIPLGLGALVAIVLTGGIIAVKMRT